MKKKSSKLKRYSHLDKSERICIEKGLRNRLSLRKIAQSLNRSASAISYEVKNNRVFDKDPTRSVIHNAQDITCEKLKSWPWVCTGCKYKFVCRKGPKVSYTPYRAQILADTRKSISRQGIDMDEVSYAMMASLITSDLKRGLSPEQICKNRQEQVPISASTIYNHIERGYLGVTNLALRRKAKYKPRKKHISGRGAVYRGDKRSYEKYKALDSSIIETTVEMDCVVGTKHDKQVLLTLFFKPAKFQLMILLEEKTSNAVTATFDRLEKLLGFEQFKSLFSHILTDRGSEFLAPEALERSCYGQGKRCSVYYCDPLQSQQKGACEKNHVEIRKLLDKRLKVSFDKLDVIDVSHLMSHVNSEPRASLCNKTPVEMFRWLYQDTADLILETFGIEHISYDELILKPQMFNLERKERGMDPLL